MAFEYGGDVPRVECALRILYNIDHYVDNLRITKSSITFEDDGKPAMIRSR